MDLLFDLLNSSEERDELASDGGVDKEDVRSDWNLSISTDRNDNAVSIYNGEVKLYPQEMGRELIEKFHALVRYEKETEDTVERTDITEEVSKLRDMDKSEIDEVISFIHGLVINRHKELLRSSLYLQRAADDPEIVLEKDIDRYKRDLKEDFGQVAYYVNHLVSSGYFNPDGFFHEMYEELEKECPNPEEKYQEDFEKIIEKELLAYYVSDDDNVESAKFGINRLISGYFQFSPHNSFVDIRGIGGDCRDTIEGSIEEFEERNGELLKKELESEKETALRVWPRSIQYLSD